MRWRAILLGSLGLALLGGAAWGQTFTSGSTGADGPFNPPTSVPPGTTVNGSTYTVPLSASGVFNFTTITIASGITVKFTRNAANTPVILLATGNVTLAGTLDVRGSNGASWGRPGPGGPGGFDGGAGSDGGLTSPYGSAGLGPGAGGVGYLSGGGGGGYATAGQAGFCNTMIFLCNSPVPAPGGGTYGSLPLRPILGGSGGSGGYGPSNIGGGGGGGGGAILVASSGTITLTGSILASGGDGSGGANIAGGGGGSGGAIRLIATALTGTGGSLTARGGTQGGSAGNGGDGRIRLEASDLSVSVSSQPTASTAYPQAVFPSAGQPTLTITSVAGIPTPASPKGTFLDAPDITLPSGTTNPVSITLAASHIPLGTTIRLTAIPQAGSATSVDSLGLSGTLESSTAAAAITVSLSRPTILTATATFALVASAGDGPIYAQGEEVKWVRIASTLGGASTLTYLTASGREVPAEQIMRR